MKQRWYLRLRYSDETNVVMHGGDYHVHMKLDREPERHLHLVLNPDEAAELRDELTRWLERRSLYKMAKPLQDTSSAKSGETE